MGTTSSRQVFEFFNNILIVIGSGPLGVLIFIKNGLFANASFFKTFTIASLTAASIYYVVISTVFVTEKALPAVNKIILISGCDSGLGYSLAQHSCEMGFTVLAGCLNLESDGAIELNKISSGNIEVLELDITKNKSIQNCVKCVEKHLTENENAIFWALVNNAGVMVFGEFEWNTERLIKQQIDVNLLGTMNITKAFLPLLRKHLGRVLTISSHCANATLPGLAVYGATKAGLAAWSDGLRVEQSKYGVHVVNFVPGSFVQQSNIMSKQNENVFEMQSAMTQEQSRFYGEYFRIYNAYLSVLSGNRKVKKISDDSLYETYEKCILDVSPAAKYVHESLRYKFYHTLFKISPVRLRDYLVVKFVQMPEWNRDEKIENISQVIA